MWAFITLWVLCVNRMRSCSAINFLREESEFWFEVSTIIVSSACNYVVGKTVILLRILSCKSLQLLKVYKHAEKMEENVKDNRGMPWIFRSLRFNDGERRKRIIWIFHNCSMMQKIRVKINFYRATFVIFFSFLCILLHFSLSCIQYDVLMTINNVSYNRRQGRITSPKNRLVFKLENSRNFMLRENRREKMS